MWRCGRRRSSPTQTVPGALSALVLHWAQLGCVVFHTLTGSSQEPVALPCSWWNVSGVSWVFRGYSIAPASSIIDRLSFSAVALPSPHGPARRRLIRQVWKIFVARVLELFDRRVHELWRFSLGQQSQDEFDNTTQLVPPSFQLWVPDLWSGLHRGG